MVGTAVLGEVLIDFFPTREGPSAGAATFSRHLGGAPANVAVGVQRLGQASALVSKVGEDPFGAFLLSVLGGEGVDVTYIRTEKRARTALAFVSRADQGEREFVFYRRPCADELLEPDEIPAELISGSAAFHFGSLSLTVEPARSATWKGVHVAKDAGVMVSMDPNVRLALWDSPEEARQVMLEAISRCDLLKLSHEEAEFLTGKSDLPRAAKVLASHGPCTVVITSAAGCHFQHRGTPGTAQGFTVCPEDTTGAGDAFMSGLLSWLLRRMDEGTSLAALQPEELFQGLRFAHAAGAVVTTAVGALPSQFTRENVKEFLARRV